MKCPRCGTWNQSYLPKCVNCGALLENNTQSGPADWEASMHEKKPKLTITSYDPKDTPDAITEKPAHDGPYDPEAMDAALLTDELEDLQRRRELGQARLQKMRDSANEVRRQLREAEVIRPLPEIGDPDYPDDRVAIRNRQRDRQAVYSGKKPSQSHASTDSSGRIITYDDSDPDAPVYYDGYTAEDDARHSHTTYMPRRASRPKRQMDYPTYAANRERSKSMTRSVLRFFLILIACAAVGIGGVLLARYFVLTRGMQIREDNETRVEVSETTVDGHPAHTIVIYGRENATVYIQEMQSSYVIADGNITLTIPDYMWFDTESSTYAVPVDTDTMDVVLNPSIRYSQEGEQYRLEPISFTVDVPLSPIYLINPTTRYAEVGVSIYEVRINVEKGSTVMIDGANVSTLIRDTGNVSKNVQVLPVGENTISISVKSKYCRENKMEITLYRSPQDIPLELNPTVIVEWNYENDDLEHVSSISGTTLPGAEITVETPHDSLTVDNTTGEFKFHPLFYSLGNNDIVIRASYPGRTDSVITHTVYYMPTADVYTRRAWDLDSQYSDLVTFINMRIGTIYVGTGVIQRIIATAPQLAVMDIGNENFEKLVMLENSSKTTWTVGTRYRIYGEAYGMYGSMPRLTVRYTYVEE